MPKAYKKYRRGSGLQNQTEESNGELAQCTKVPKVPMLASPEMRNRILLLLQSTGAHRLQNEKQVLVKLEPTIVI